MTNIAAIDIFESLSYINPRYIEEADADRLRVVKQHISKTARTILIAAIIAALFAAIAYASGLFGLIGRLIIDSGIADQGEYSSETTDVLDSLCSVYHRDYISLSGVSGSPEYRAAAEWLLFRGDYSEQKAAEQIDKGQPYFEWRDLERSFASDEEIAEICRLYQVWDTTMWDKLQEIANKYNLLLHKERTMVIGDAAIQRAHGQYEDGSFIISVKLLMDHGPVFYELYSERKGYLPCDDLAVSGSEEYNEWEYTNIYNQSIYIAMRDMSTKESWTENEYLLFYSDENVTMTVKAFFGNQSNDLTDKEKFAEQLADSIDFVSVAFSSSPEEAIIILKGE